MNGLLVVCAVLFVVSLSMLWYAGHLRQRTGLPPGRIIYSDTSTWQDCPEALYAPSINLTGKPDYLVEKWNYVIPIEIKSSQAPAEPYRSHILQLAAYCLLVEETVGRRPPYGLISYQDSSGSPARTFSIRYTERLEDELLDTIEWLRQDWLDKAADRDHHDPLRCRVCGYAEYCDQCLIQTE